MKGPLRQLAEKVAWAESHDGGAMPGVLAVPRRPSVPDVAASESVLGASADELIERVSQVPPEPAEPGGERKG